MKEFTITIGAINSTFDSPDAIEHGYKSNESLTYYVKYDNVKDYFYDYEELGYIIEELCKKKIGEKK